MHNTNNTLVIGLLALVAGLFIGSFLAPGFGMMRWGGWSSGMEDHMEEYGHMHADEHDHDDILDADDLIRQDGAMQHAMEEMMFGFRGKTGEAYEEAFLKGMIVHHAGAVEMAEGLLEETDRPELRAFAHDIIDAQSQEIATMRDWLETWFNND